MSWQSKFLWKIHFYGIISTFTHNYYLECHSFDGVSKFLLWHFTCQNCDLQNHYCFLTLLPYSEYLNRISRVLFSRRVRSAVSHSFSLRQIRRQPSQGSFSHPEEAPVFTVERQKHVCVWWSTQVAVTALDSLSVCSDNHLWNKHHESCCVGQVTLTRRCVYRDYNETWI